jgi:hypothetical protein
MSSGHCEIIRCKNPIFNNGRIEATRREYKSKGKLICNTGYKLAGDSKATCQDDGTWMSSGHCEIIRCKISTFNNGRIETTRREYKSKGKLICNTGYKLTGDSEATCQDDGTWMSSGHCEIIRCKISTFNNGRIEDTRREYKSKGKLICNTGYKLAGDSKATCQDDGTWMSSGHCEIIRCKNPIFNNGRIEATRREYKSKGKLICNTGYKLAGDSKATCQDDGTWRSSGHCESM